MPVTRKMQRRRRPAPMRRRRKVAVPRAITAKRQPIHAFTRQVQFSFTGAVANPAYGVLTYGLNALPNYTELTALFDQYRITFIKHIWQLNLSPEAQAAASSQYPRLYTFNDFTDTTTPTTLDEFRERQRTKIRMLHPAKPVVTTVRPAVSTEIFKALGGVAVNAPKWKLWLPCESADINHIGTKYALENFTNTNYTITLTMKYYIQTKMVK